METLRIDIWSDIACPWCYVGKRRLEAALGLDGAPRVELVWRSFELDPAAPKVAPADPPYTERLAKKYGTSPERAGDMIQRMSQVAATDGIDMRFDRIRPGNTFDAHRLVHLAKSRGLQDAMKERLFRAYLTEGEAIGDPAVLERLGAEVGLDPQDIRDLLGSDRYAADVRGDETQARELGITGVPFFVIGGKYGISGAQSADVLASALQRAHAELTTAVDDVGVCGPDGCVCGVDNPVHNPVDYLWETFFRQGVTPGEHDTLLTRYSDGPGYPPGTFNTCSTSLSPSGTALAKNAALDGVGRTGLYYRDLPFGASDDVGTENRLRSSSSRARLSSKRRSTAAC